MQLMGASLQLFVYITKIL